MTFVSHPLVKPETIEARLYQEVLVSRIIDKGNSLVVAPTALGKTVVAVMLAAHILYKDKKADQETSGKKILFLAPTKPLAVQHEKSFKRFLAIGEEKIVSITGTTKAKEREKIYQDALVINATPQTIENDLLNGKLSLKDFGLVIFDEAHRAAGDYSYVFVAMQLQKQNPNCLIVALTASPGSEEEKIQDVCKNLFIKNIEIKNTYDADVKPYVNEIEIDWVRVDLPVDFLRIKVLLEGFQARILAELKGIGVAITANKKYYNRVRLLEMQQKIRTHRMGAHKNPMYFAAASKCAALLKVAHAEELIETQGIGALNNYFDKILEEAARGKSKAAKGIIKDESIHEAICITKTLFEKKVQHPKYAELKRIILAQLQQKPDSKVIVFNHYRDSILEVVSFLNGDEKGEGNEKVIDGEVAIDKNSRAKIRATKFIGQATKGDEKGMSQKIQQEVLDELRADKYNVLVASSVAEEGLDIPSVELVVFFEPVPSEIRTIQRRGRTGRFSKGKAVILMARNTRDEAFYWAGKAKENNMRKTLKSMKEDIALPQQATLNNFVSEKKNEIIIFVDNREHASSVTKELFGREGVKTIVRQLDVGDYVLSKDVCVERKTTEDFLSSMIDGRMFKQLVDLRTNYQKPMVIVEGNVEEMFTLRDIHRNSIIGALTSIALDYQVPILFTKDDKETAEYLYVIAKREQIGRDKEIGLRIGRKGLTLGEQQRFVMEGFPLVGPLLAKGLLEKFGSIKAIINADEKQLQEVEGLGKKKAKLLKKITEAKFDPEGKGKKEKNAEETESEGEEGGEETEEYKEKLNEAGEIMIDEEPVDE